MRKVAIREGETQGPGIRHRALRCLRRGARLFILNDLRTPVRFETAPFRAQSFLFSRGSALLLYSETRLRAPKSCPSMRCALFCSFASFLEADYVSRRFPATRGARRRHSGPFNIQPLNIQLCKSRPGRAACPKLEAKVQ